MLAGAVTGDHATTVKAGPLQASIGALVQGIPGTTTKVILLQQTLPLTPLASANAGHTVADQVAQQTVAVVALLCA